MAASDKIFIYGKHAVSEALAHAPKSVRKVYAVAPDPELSTLAKKVGLSVSPFTGEMPDSIEGGSHQGVFAQINVKELLTPYEGFMATLKPNAAMAIVVLAEVQDPHNVGAAIRSAAAFGASAVFIPEHNQAPVTGAVVKVSAGMAFRIPLVPIGNVNLTLRALKDKGFWVYGLAGEKGAQPLTQEKFDSPAVFVLGNEGDGIREKTREACDILLSVPMHPRCESLNAAASMAVVLYEWSRQHNNALHG